METVSGGVVHLLAVHDGGLGYRADRVRVLVPGTVPAMSAQAVAKSARRKCLTKPEGWIKIMSMVARPTDNLVGNENPLTGGILLIVCYHGQSTGRASR